jgi:hypothetical protein
MLEVAYRVSIITPKYGESPSLGNETELKFHCRWYREGQQKPALNKPPSKDELCEWH